MENCPQHFGEMRGDGDISALSQDDSAHPIPLTSSSLFFHLHIFSFFDIVSSNDNTNQQVLLSQEALLPFFTQISRLKRVFVMFFGFF